MMALVSIVKSSLRSVVAASVAWLALTSITHGELPPIIGVIRSDTSQTLFGYNIVPLGDQNGDGFADLLIWDFRSSLYLYHGGKPPDSNPYLRIDSVGQPVSNVGDLNGDSYDDFVVEGRSPYGWKLNLYWGGPSADTQRDSWFGLDGTYVMGSSKSGLDLNCDGINEIFGRELVSQEIDMFNIKNPQVTLPELRIRPYWFTQPAYMFGDGVVVMDINGDGRRDLICNLRPYHQYQIKGEICVYLGRCDFDTVVDLRFTQPGPFEYGKEEFGVVLKDLGDVNADGFDDLFVGHGNSLDTVNYIYFGGPTFDSIPDLVIPDYTEHAAAAGDLNGDGIDDFMTSFSMESSSYSYVNIYYGGKHVDSIPDIRLNVSEMPEYLLKFGMDIAGLGDVNGDSINDFAVSAVDNNGRGVVYIFSGNRSGTTVDEVKDRPMPKSISLMQNYPNPFNPSTSIDFTLPTRSRVVLDVFNPLGQHVKTLLNETASVGTHKVEWDGTDAAGNRLASGVYLYRIRAGEYVETKKMMLLK